MPYPSLARSLSRSLGASLGDLAFRY